MNDILVENDGDKQGYAGDISGGLLMSMQCSQYDSTRTKAGGYKFFFSVASIFEERFVITFALSISFYS